MTTTSSCEIAQLGSSVLRQVALPVTNLNSPDIQKLITSLLTTVKEAGGVGIAAPQISVSKRIFVVCSAPSARYPDAPKMAPTVMINPEITSHNGSLEHGWEGCLSVPKLRGLVPRYTEINIAYTNINGEQVRDVYQGFLARIFQHELDHLDGIAFVDRVDSKNDIIDEQEWYKKYA